MRRFLIACGLLTCASSVIASDGLSQKDAAAESREGLVRIETRAGAFLVRQSFADEFRVALAGELPERPLYAGR